MSDSIALSSELRKLVEARIEQTARGVEDTLKRIQEVRAITPMELKADLRSLEGSFSILSQKWSLEILYTLFLTNGAARFNELKRVLEVNSRTLSDKLRTLTDNGYIERNVDPEPPLRVEYTLSVKGRNTVLLAIPLLYYSVST
jgi:DNA-binding HxlR family transcriptional regulator